MSEVRITPQEMVKTGITPSYTGSLSTDNTYLIRNTGRTFIHVKNAGGSDSVVTVVTPGTVGGIAISDLTVTVGDTDGDKMIGPFEKGIFDDSDGDITVSFSYITSVTIAAVNL